MKIAAFVRQHLILFSLLLLLVILRIPNFFEPYWYGDEAIYLTVGTAMRHGERLYAEIIDHKTPIIYYLAMVPSQFYFRVLNLVSMVATTTLFYVFLKKIIFNKTGVFLALLLFVTLTTLPWFEGVIPNGELFVMFFVCAGATLLAKTELFRQFLGQSTGLTSFLHKQERHQLPDIIFLFAAGVFFSLGILTKVPALFDLLAFLFIFWLVFIDSVGKKWQVITATLVCMSGVAIPIVLSIVYFMIRGSGQAYLNYGLLYNFRYAGSWVPTFAWPWLAKLFTLPMKAGLLAVFLLLLTVSKRWLTPRFRFIAAWFGLALFASLLSNRPYPHYYLQVIPPLALLFAYVWQALWQRPRHLKEVSLSVILIAVFLSILQLLHVGLYSSSDYYLKFYRLVTQQMSATAYRDSFNSLDADNYQAAEIIRPSHDQRMFIWGTNPMLYALSGKSPTGRFTVAFHIFDFHAEAETLQDVKDHAPQYVVIMKEERVFADLFSYVTANYTPVSHFQYFTLWQRR